MDAVTQSQISDRFDAVKSSSIQLRNSTVQQRRAKLKRLEKWILTNRTRIHEALFKDLQKSSQETDLTEIYVVLTEIREARKKLKIWMQDKPVASTVTYLGTSAKIHYEPKGACLIISPWNYPFQLAIAPLVSAIAAGNSVVLKPSEFSEHTSELMKKMVEELFSSEEITVILGGVEESQQLLSLPFDHMFFTGSPNVGKIVMGAAAKHLSSVTLELGGKSPTIVDKTANIKDAAEKIAWGKWQNAGQVCVAPDYVWVHEDKKNQLIEELVIQSEKLYGTEEYTEPLSTAITITESMISWLMPLRKALIWSLVENPIEITFVFLQQRSLM